MKQVFLLLLSASTLLACQKKITSDRVSWSLNGDNKALALIEKQEWSKQSSELNLKNEKIVITQQSFEGKPIENSYLKQFYKKTNGQFVLVNAEALILSPPSTKDMADLSFNENIITIRLQSLNENFLKLSKINSGIVYVEREKSLIPAFKISFFDRIGEPWTAYADQKNTIFSLVREGSHFEGRVSVETTVFPSGPKLSSLTDVILNNLNIQPALSTPELVVTSEADKKIVSLEQSMKFEPKDVRFDQVQAFYYLNRSLDWMKEKMSIAFARQLEVVVHVGFPEKTNTAFYFQNKIRLGSGDDQVYSQIPQDPSIIGHESFHYLIDQVARLPFEAEGGSLNEAFADFLTCTMLNRPELADSSYLKGPYKRTLDMFRALKDKNGGLYHDSLIVSSLLWEISQTIGSEKSLNLALEVLKTLHRFSDFEDFNNRLIEKVNELLKKEDIELVLPVIRKRGFHA